MQTRRELLLRILRDARGKAITVEDVLTRARIDPGAMQQLKKELRDLLKEGVIAAEGKRFRIAAPKPAPKPVPVAAPQAPLSATGSIARMLPPRPLAGAREVTGTLTRKAEGYGFIAPVHGGEDLFVPPQAMGDALDGDLVLADPMPGRDGRPVARTMKVLERRRQFAVGTFRAEPHAAWVEPRDTALGQQIFVEHTRVAKNGDVVRVRLDEFTNGEIRGTVVSRLGAPGEPNVEVLSVAYANGFSDVFPPDALRAAEETPDHVRDEDRTDRRDLTTIDLITIDGEDARDFDDAVYVERTPRGYRLVVAIADVTAYVAPGSALDREAVRRTTSVYFPQTCLPMLPERLSNGICSLNPNVDRLCMVADMTLDFEGRHLDADLYPAVMRSRARCTYTEIAQLIDGVDVPKLTALKPMVDLAAILAARLTRNRIDRGSIDFDLPEAHPVLDKDGKVASIERRPRNAAHRLIEEFMLSANEAVARFFDSRKLSTVYRVHGKPKEQKLESFVQMAQAFGYEVSLDDVGHISPVVLNEFLRKVEGKPEQRALNNLLLRSMMQAIYSAKNIGHFGLAADAYLHFTSPIRRYPDLLVHRLLKEHWARGPKSLSEPSRVKQAEELESIAAHCSERERAATDAEREIDAFYAASLMVDRVGEKFNGTIVSVAEFGLFVELADPFVEGLVPAETIAASWKFDPEKLRLVVGEGARSFGAGDAVEVQVESASPAMRRIELRLIENGIVLSRPRTLQKSRPTAQFSRPGPPPARKKAPKSHWPSGKPKGKKPGRRHR